MSAQRVIYITFKVHSKSCIFVHPCVCDGWINVPIKGLVAKQQTPGLVFSTDAWRCHFISLNASIAVRHIILSAYNSKVNRNKTMTFMLTTHRVQVWEIKTSCYVLRKKKSGKKNLLETAFGLTRAANYQTRLNNLGQEILTRSCNYIKQIE